MVGIVLVFVNLMNAFAIQLKSRQSVFSSILLTEGCACDLRGTQAAHSKTLSEISVPEGVSVMCASADCLNVVDVLTIGFCMHISSLLCLVIFPLILVDLFAWMLALSLLLLTLHHCQNTPFELTEENCRAKY